MEPEAPSRAIVPVVPRQPWGVLCLAASLLTFPGMATMTAAGVGRDTNAWAVGFLQFVVFVAAIALVGPARTVGAILFIAAVLWQWTWGVLILLRSGEARA